MIFLLRAYQTGEWFLIMGDFFLQEHLAMSGDFFFFLIFMTVGNEGCYQDLVDID